MNFNIKVLSVPPASKWINGELSFNQLKTINIENLLEREAIHLDADKISEQLNQKVVLMLKMNLPLVVPTHRTVILHCPVFKLHRCGTTVKSVLILQRVVTLNLE